MVMGIGQGNLTIDEGYHYVGYPRVAGHGVHSPGVGLGGQKRAKYLLLPYGVGKVSHGLFVHNLEVNLGGREDGLAFLSDPLQFVRPLCQQTLPSFHHGTIMSLRVG